MTTIWRSGHFHAPSIEHFLDKLTSDLQEGRSLIVLLPNSTKPTEVRRALAQRLDAAEWKTMTLRLREVEDIPQAIEELARPLGIEWQPAKIPRTVDNLLRLHRTQHPEEEVILFFDGLDRIGEAARAIWLELLIRWSDTTHAIANSAVPIATLCLIDQAESLLTHLPNSMLYLQLHWWWALPSRIEVQLYCHNLLDPGEEREANLWREYLLPHLAGNDVDLLQYLWNRLFCEPQEVTACLAGYAQSRWPDTQVTRSELTAHGWAERPARQWRQPEPPLEFRRLWADGVIASSPEHGVELHPAMAAALGHRQTVYHRLWRGQAALILPLLDQIRLTLCTYFTGKYGHDWPICWGEPVGEERDMLAENPLASEWRFLHKVLKYDPVPSELRRFIPLAKQGLDLRNCLAHYQPVAYQAFEEFWREQKGLGEQL